MRVVQLQIVVIRIRLAETINVGPRRVLTYELGYISRERSLRDSRKRFLLLSRWQRT